MSFSDSMFLFEIVVEGLKSYIDYKDFCVKCQFAHYFTINLKDPNDLGVLKPKMKVTKAWTHLANGSAVKSERKVQTGQSILFSSQIVNLISTMKKSPIEISLYNKEKPRKKLGYTHVPWSPIYIEYLYNLYDMPEPSPVHIRNGFNVYDDLNSRRIATITLSTKLTHLKDKATSSFRSLLHKNQRKFICTGVTPKPPVSLSTTTTINEVPTLTQKIGLIKRKPKTLKKGKSNQTTIKESVAISNEIKPIRRPVETQRLPTTTIRLVKSDSKLHKREQTEVINTKSCMSMNTTQYNLSDYIFGDNRRLCNHVYCVGYFTVENDFDKDASTSKESSKQDQCSSCLRKGAADSEYNGGKCDGSDGKSDDIIKINVGKAEECCNIGETVENVVGGVKARMNYDKESCFCSCECTFGFVKHTRYCGICGGYENIGEDMSHKLFNAPFPCPIFHKLTDKIKQKTSASGSDRSRNKGDEVRSKKGSKSNASHKPQVIESEKDIRKKKRKNDQFKFNYGYTAPQSGHIKCAMPCIGTLGAVPQNMGWLWTAETIPGLKFRPNWKPGASNKYVVRLLKMAKNPGKIITKKKRREAGKKKSLKRPLLTVAKKDGEYTVTMETMKIYPKQRALNQPPYDEDKPAVTFTIGRTEEENRERRRKKEREKRRIERDQRAFIKSAFSDMCKEICLKTYRQALGILPGAEDPDCSCYPKDPGSEDVNLDLSCSCSEDNAINHSDTDSDEWMVEFTPPIATFNPTYIGKKIQKADKSSQYSYLDYRVKLLDRSGNQVPRYFRGPNGKIQCSDLGGFWSNDHKWLEINNDGFIAPDGRWAPMIFVLPNGEQVDCGSTGKFQTADLKSYVVGIDGYVDSTNTWKFYPKSQRPKERPQRKKQVGGKKGAGDKKDDKLVMTYKPSETTWSCLGDADPKELSKLGILGHGQDKKLLLQALKLMLDHGEDVKIPQPPVVPRHPGRKKVKDNRFDGVDSRTYFTERQRCRHPVPSGRGIVIIGDYGHKKYFKSKDYKNKRPHERMAQLANQGIDLSAFHTPCFHSATNIKGIKKLTWDRRVDILSKLGQDRARISVAAQCE